MKVPVFHGLGVADLVRSPGSARPFPFDAPTHHYFYRARNAIFYLFKALRSNVDRLVVLAPDYNSGNEELAMRAAGATIRHYAVGRNMTLDPSAVERLCETHRPDVLYVTHYLGWPQPMTAIVDLCRRRGIRLVEDCALALLSECDGRPLGSFGDWSIFCLYKTLPLPNGALLIQNGPRLEALERLKLRDAGSASVMGRAAELVVQRIRGQANGLGAALQVVKRGMGRAAGALAVHRANVGDIGFNLDEVDLAMSRLSARLLAGFDYEAIRQRRVDNYRRLDGLLDQSVARVFPTVPDGACPLFFPIVVPDKQATAERLRSCGVDAPEFWNDSSEPGGQEMGPDAQFLRQHVLELPIHQDLTPRHIDHIARHVNGLGGLWRAA